MTTKPLTVAQPAAEQQAPVGVMDAYDQWIRKEIVPNEQAAGWSWVAMTKASFVGGWNAHRLASPPAQPASSEPAEHVDGARCAAWSGCPKCNQPAEPAAPDTEAGLVEALAWADRMAELAAEWDSNSNAAVLAAAYRASEQRCRGLEAALNSIASWKEGDEVTGSFDEPHSAAIARAAINSAKGGNK